ncbi:MAG: peptidoglycan-binding protein [Sodalinema sp.]|uniref:peptidoglycan-binding domain-containing protein n=1 Tax=Sodalinema sp. TaxID=3080550 RepID=UPI00396F637A
MSHFPLLSHRFSSIPGPTVIVLMSLMLWGGTGRSQVVRASVPGLDGSDLGREAIAQPLAQTTEILQFADTGDDVAEVQLLLTEFGYFTEPVSGFFGRETRTAVADFQEDAGLPVNGRVDRETRRALFGESVSERLFSSNRWLSYGDPVLMRGDETAIVAELQAALNEIGLGPIPEDSVYGNQTAAAVRDFQRRYGIDAPVLGELDRRTALILSGVLEGRIPPPEARIELSRGDMGFEVHELQRVLTQTRRPQGDTYFADSPTGFYGSITEGAVRAYQRDNNLAATGIATERTLERLFAGHRYVVVVPFRPNRSRLGEMNRVRSAIARLDDLPGLRPQALRFYDDRRGPYIDAGWYRQRDEAEARVAALRDRGLMNARVEHFNDLFARMRLSQADLGTR